MVYAKNALEPNLYYNYPFTKYLSEPFGPTSTGMYINQISHRFQTISWLNDYQAPLAQLLIQWMCWYKTKEKCLDVYQAPLALEFVTQILSLCNVHICVMYDAYKYNVEMHDAYKYDADMYETA